MQWTDLLLTLILAVGLFAAGAVGLYFFAQWFFTRAADRATRQFESALSTLAEYSRASTARRVGSNVTARPATDRSTGWARYAAAEGVDQAQARQQFQNHIERLARLMDSAIEVPILGRVGLDAVLGLFPFLGDATSAAVSLTLIARSLQFGIPRELVAKMLANVLMDVVLGAIPVVGDLADIWFRANVRNVALMREYLDSITADAPDVRVVTTRAERL